MSAYIRRLSVDFDQLWVKLKNMKNMNKEFLSYYSQNVQVLKTKLNVLISQKPQVRISVQT